MSRAFTKEEDAGDDLPERPVSEWPNYADLRYVEARILSAIMVPPGTGHEIRFGAHVTYKDDAGQEKSFQIVGEDEARTTPGVLAWTAPFVQAMFGAKPGDGVLWEGPSGREQLTIVAVEYRRT